MDGFSPISATLGGILIGLAAVILMHFNGRIAGISGIFRGAIFEKGMNRLWSIMFLVGLVLAPVVWGLVGSKPIPFEMTTSWPLIVIGGLVVGIGTRLGSGCTSGHGVCGLARVSPRSMLAVGFFMTAGVITVTLVRTVWG